MNWFGNFASVTGIGYLMFSVFIVASLGYLLGRITVKGVSLGTAGVFIIALLFGCFFYSILERNTKGYTSSALKIVENLGLVLFVTSVGFIAGPNFFSNLKKNFKSYILLGVLIIVVGGLSCAACIVFDIKLGRAPQEAAAMLVGLLSGSLTSTPAFSAAKATVATAELESIVAVGHGIAYIYGVIGVVLFVQIVPKIIGANMEEERSHLVAADAGSKKVYNGKLIEMDAYGFMPFALAAVVGILVGGIDWGKMIGTVLRHPEWSFTLTTTGGCLFVSLIFGHFAHVGPVDITPLNITLKEFRELGLMLFLIGAGIAGGASFVKYFEWVYFIYGIIMTTVPLIVGYFFARYVLKLSLLNNLGSITGGMTSTPALGTLIATSGTENVASAYASTYPMALIAVVIVSQVLIILFR
ncbi:MAG: permease [Treponema sp.]|nr:permease [Treponema sp.]